MGVIKPYSFHYRLYGESLYLKAGNYEMTVKIGTAGPVDRRRGQRRRCLPSSEPWAWRPRQASR